MQQTEYKPTSGLPGIREKSEEYLAWRWDVHVALLAAGHMSEAYEFIDCEDPETLHAYKVCPEDVDHYCKAVVHTCHKRYCPECARRETARLLARYKPHFEGRVKHGPSHYRVRHIVFTTKFDLHHPDARKHLSETWKLVHKAMDQALGKGWHKKGQGYVGAADYGEAGRKLHTHLAAFCAFIDQEELSKIWESLTGCKVVWIEEMSTDEALHEVLKYATKLTTLSPPDVVALRDVIKGQRRVRSRGCFYAIDLVEVPHTCEVCGAVIVKWSLGQYERHVENLYLTRGNNSGCRAPPESPKMPIRGVLL